MYTNPNQEEINPNAFPSLYNTITYLHKLNNPVSRILYVAKIKETEKATREQIISNFNKELKKYFSKYDNKINCLVLYLGVTYSLIMLEVYFI
jgi:hypothetical protein